MEEWRDIDNTNGIYQVSSKGRVRSKGRYAECKNGKRFWVEGRIMSIRHNKRINCYEVYLRVDGKRKAEKIHRLVAKAFIENDDPVRKTTVDHKDGNRSNNKKDNLEWTSYSENLKHAYDILKDL